MKKTLTYLACTLILIFTLAACSKDKEPDPQPVLPEKLDGTWFLHKQTTVIYDSLDQLISKTETVANSKHFEYNFTPPSGYREKIVDKERTGTYKVSQDSLIITIPETPTSTVTKTYIIESLLPGELTVSQTALTPSAGKRTFINIWKR